MIEIRLLGRFAALRDDDEIPGERFGGRLPRRLVRVLATRLDEVVPRDVLIDSLWPRRPPADREGNLNVLVNRARRALAEPDVIVTATGGYRLRGDRCRVDAVEFRRAVDDGCREVEDGRPAIGLQTLLDALALWQEPLPEDAYEEWAQPVRRDLLLEHQLALETAAGAALLVNHPRPAVALAQRAVAHEPLREQAHLLLVRALAASGDRHGALQALGALRRTLADELGLQPSPEAEAVERDLLDGAAGPRTKRHIRPPLPSTAPFVGRAAELARLVDLVSKGEVAMVEAGPGYGKTALLAELSHRIDRPVLATRAFLPQAATPWALARAIVAEALTHDVDAAAELSAAGRQALQDLVLPELGEQVSGPSVRLEDQSRRALAMEAAVRVLASTAAGGGVLVVDDLQWADATSLQLLALATARIAHLPLVLAHRPLDPTGHVAAFMAQLHHLGPPAQLRLGPLALDDLRELVGDGVLAGVLQEETDGSPFAVLEVLRRLVDAGFDLTAAWGGTGLGDDRYEAARVAARAGKRRSILARLAQQPPELQQLVRLMAVLGREASAGLLAVAAGRTARQVLDDLDRLAHVGLVRLGDHGWATAHDLITETVTGELSRAQRGRLHLLLADALDGEAGGPGERAVHLQGGGDDRAGAAFARAAREQLDRHAHHEAGRLAESGLAITRDPATCGELLAVRAEVRAHGGDLRGARDDLHRAMSQAATSPERSLLRTRTAALAVADGDLDRAGQLVDLALLEAGDHASARARALALGSIIDMNRQDDDRSESRATEAMALYEALGDAGGVADVLDARAMATFLQGDIGAGVEAFARVAELYASSGNLLRVVTPRSTRGHGLVFLDQPEAALAETCSALELARSLGHAEGCAYALWHHSEALVAAGQSGDALAAAEESLAIAQRLGHYGWTATALRAIGLAHEADGRITDALDAHQRSLDAARGLPLFTCWARARLSLTLLRLGDLRRAGELAALATAEGPPLGQYEARLAEAAVSRARGEPRAARLASRARDLARSGGHRLSLRLLEELR